MTSTTQRMEAMIRSDRTFVSCALFALVLAGCADSRTRETPDAGDPYEDLARCGTEGGYYRTLERIERELTPGCERLVGDVDLVYARITDLGPSRGSG
ncbi:MAG: hypothetical protein M3Y87_32145 [Myxococcota bacterium]|nr:hypothetical protein [Myxococcota bacterium]